MLYPNELRAQNSENWSGQRDLNPRHPAPKAGALPDCAMPRLLRQAQKQHDTNHSAEFQWIFYKQIKDIKYL